MTLIYMTNNKSSRNKGMRPNTTSAVSSRPNDVLQKNKVIVLADSHGRNLGNYLNTAVNDRVQVLSICKPGAGLEVVISDIKGLLNDLTKNDYLVVIGGSNDITQSTNGILSSKMKNLLCSLGDKTNVIFLTLTLRYDRPNLNHVIYR